MEYIDEIAPITQEQWDRVMAWGRRRDRLGIGKNGEASLQAARDFSESIKQLQANAGKASEQLPGLQGAILDMAKQEE